MRPLGIFTDPDLEEIMYPMPPRSVFFRSDSFVDENEDNSTIPIPPFFQRYDSTTKEPVTPSPEEEEEEEEPLTPEPSPRVPQRPSPLEHKAQLQRAFKPLLVAGYKPMDEAFDIGVQYGYILDREQSIHNTYVYVSTITDFPLIVHRGSVTLADWLVEDTLILTGFGEVINSPRVLQAKRITNRVRKKYKKPVDSFGHSLGGMLSEESGADGIIMTYNKAVGIGDAMRSIGANQIDYKQAKDIVSALAGLQPRKNKIRYIDDAGFLNAHTVDALPEIAPERRRA